MPANDKQVGGDHYKNKVQHWDWAASNDLDYFQGSITKYVARWKNKNGLEDLKKAQHFLEKYIEMQEGTVQSPGLDNFPYTLFLGKDIYNSFNTSTEAIGKARQLFDEGVYKQSHICIRHKVTKELIQWKRDT